MVARAQRRRCFRVLDDRADFLADQLGKQLVAIDIHPLVSPELGQQVDQITPGPCFLEALTALRVA
jgi:hypothetical protein